MKTMRVFAVVFLLLIACCHASSQCNDYLKRGLEFAMVDFVSDSAAIVIFMM